MSAASSDKAEEAAPALFCTVCFRRWKSTEASKICSECSGELRVIPAGSQYLFRPRPIWQFSLEELGIITALVGVNLALAIRSPVGAAIAILAITPATVRTLAYARRFQEHGLSAGTRVLLLAFGESLFMLYPAYLIAVIVGITAGTLVAIPFFALGVIDSRQEMPMLWDLFAVLSPAVGFIAAAWSFITFSRATWPSRPAHGDKRFSSGSAHLR
jgi:hypothetical protein